MSAISLLCDYVESLFFVFLSNESQGNQLEFFGTGFI